VSFAYELGLLTCDCDVNLVAVEDRVHVAVIRQKTKFMGNDQVLGAR